MIMNAVLAVALGLRPAQPNNADQTSSIVTRIMPVLSAAITKLSMGAATRACAVSTRRPARRTNSPLLGTATFRESSAT